MNRYGYRASASMQRRGILTVVVVTAAAFVLAVDRVRAADDDTTRTPLRTVVPEYPEMARRDRVEGDVQVCFNVDRKGNPFRIAVRSSTNRVFEKPAIRAVRSSRYQPLPKEIELSGIKTCRTFRFRLDAVSRVD